MVLPWAQAMPAAEYRHFRAFEDENARLTGGQRPKILGVVRLKFLSLENITRLRRFAVGILSPSGSPRNPSPK